MPKLVAFYLREFSYNKDYEPSVLYRFVFCLCLPFVSKRFREARLVARAIAECTNSADQIVRVLAAITGTTVSISLLYNEFLVSYDGTDNNPESMITYSKIQNEKANVPYLPVNNEGVIYIIPGDVDKSLIESYLKLLTPFYVKYKIIYI